MSVFNASSLGLLRAPIDKMLSSEAVLGAVERQIGRYAELRALRCADQGGVEAVLCVKGFSEEFRVVLSKVELAEDGSWFTPSELKADRAGIQALLDDLVRGRRFPIPEKVRPFTGMLKKLFA